MSLEGKAAIVTGVSKGIGKATVIALLTQGVKVVGWGRNDLDVSTSFPKEKAQHGKSINWKNYSFSKVDVRDKKNVEQAYAQFKESHVQADILVNNAGLGIFKFMQNITEQEWDLMFDTNVKGIYNCTVAVLNNMIEQKSGHIVNIASTAATTGIPEATAYCGSKWAVRGISASLQQEVKKKGIRVTCIMPGSVNTEFFENYNGVTANPTMLAPQDIANAVIHSLSAPNNCCTAEMIIKPLNPSYKV